MLRPAFPWQLPLVVVAFTGEASALPPSHVYCDSGTWGGVSVYFADGDPSVTDETIGLPDMVYEIKLSVNIAKITTRDKSTMAKVVNRRRNFVVISYLYGGVHYTDTLLDTGDVITQYTTMAMSTVASVVTFHRQCKILR